MLKGLLPKYYEYLIFAIKPSNYLFLYKLEMLIVIPTQNVDFIFYLNYFSIMLLV